MSTNPKTAPIWVVKVGSQLLEQGGAERIADWMRQIAIQPQIRWVWVTSGAIATGRRLLQKIPKILTEKQALSAIGQVAVMDEYNRALSAYQKRAGQVLLTPRDLSDLKSRKLFVQTVRQLLDWGVLPILNENDAVANDEIRFGDNDQLSCQAAIALGAKRLILLSDVEGVLDAQGKVLSRLSGLTPAKIRTLARAQTLTPQTLGSGGMLSKLMAAHQAAQKKILVRIASGAQTSVLLEDASGTWIVPSGRSRARS